MNAFEQYAEGVINGYWLPVAFIFGTAGWALLALLWGVQAYMAARGTRWPAMYIHLFKMSAALIFAMFFLLSLMWRDTSAPVTRLAFSRNILNTVVMFALFVEACWRIKETTKATIRRGRTREAV